MGEKTEGFTNKDHCNHTKEINAYFLLRINARRYMAEILPIRRKTLSYPSINQPYQGYDIIALLKYVNWFKMVSRVSDVAYGSLDCLINQFIKLQICLLVRAHALFVKRIPTLHTCTCMYTSRTRVVYQSLWFSNLCVTKSKIKMHNNQQHPFYFNY